MIRVPRRALRSSHICLILVAALLGACRSKEHAPAVSLEITRVPPGGEGGPDQMEVIAGRARGATQGQQIILYAKNGIWWVQPFKSRPFTKIESDMTWSSSTHVGAEYAALLVDPGYRPQSRIGSLPGVGNGVAAVAVVQGGPATPVVLKTIHFSGYDWTVRSTESERGGEMNPYDPANAWVDQRGYLHLRMGLKDGRWSNAEVNLTRSLGYGTYKFVVQDSARLNPWVVFGMFTLDERRADDVRKELDIELSHWGLPDKKDAQYVVQPYYIPENISRFTTPAGEVTHVLRWEPGTASFASYRGARTGPGVKSISEHVFSSGVPTAAAETVHIDLYDFYHSKREKHFPAEVVIERFEYLP